jgi:stage V sporulation protein B
MYIVAAFAVSGLTVGVAAGVIFMSITKFLNRNREEQKNGEIKTVRKNGEIMREIIKSAVPITLSASLLSLSPLIDTFTMTRRLIDAGFAEETARAAFGHYSAQAISIFNFPGVLVIPFAWSIIPGISMAFANKNTEAIKTTIESTFRVVLIISVPCAFGIAVMARPILALIFAYREAVEATAPLLSVLAVAVVFIAMIVVTNAMLQAQKQERKVIISTGCGTAVKLISSYVLVGIPEINKFGTPISSVLCYLTIMAINFYFLVKHTGVTLPVRRVFIKPFIAGAVMSVCAVLVYMLFNNILNGSRTAAIPAIIIAAGVYIILTLAFKTLRREDVLLLPKGAAIYEAMKSKNLID